MLELIIKYVQEISRTRHSQLSCKEAISFLFDQLNHDFMRNNADHSQTAYQSIVAIWDIFRQAEFDEMNVYILGYALEMFVPIMVSGAYPNIENYKEMATKVIANPVGSLSKIEAHQFHQLTLFSHIFMQFSGEVYDPQDLDSYPMEFVINGCIEYCRAEINMEV